MTLLLVALVAGTCGWLARRVFGWEQRLIGDLLLDLAAMNEHCADLLDNTQPELAADLRRQAAGQRDLAAQGPTS